MQVKKELIKQLIKHLRAMAEFYTERLEKIKDGTEIAQQLEPESVEVEESPPIVVRPPIVVSPPRVEQNYKKQKKINNHKPIEIINLEDEQQQDVLQKSFQCSFCNKAYYTSEQMIRHEYIHIRVNRKHPQNNPEFVFLKSKANKY